MRWFMMSFCCLRRLVFVLVSMFLVRAAPVDQVDAPHLGDGTLASGTTGSSTSNEKDGGIVVLEGALRSRADRMKELQSKTFEFSADKIANSLPEERVDAVQSLQKDVIQEASQVLSEVKSVLADNPFADPAYRDHLERILQSGQNQAQALDERVLELTRLLKSAQGNSNSDSNNVKDNRRLNQNANNPRSSGNQEGQGENNASRHADRIWDKHRRMVHSSKRNTNLHRSLLEIHQGILNGDRRPLESFTDATHQRHARGQPSHDAGRRQLQDKVPLLCQTLATCASRMSLYDLFVFYHADDINPTTGEMDEKIVRFDEVNILQKKENITSMSSLILNNGDQTQCDELLRHFHRTNEKSDVPQWHGATVAEVCIAEGTTIFVKLEEAASLSFVTPELVMQSVAIAGGNFGNRPTQGDGCRLSICQTFIQYEGAQFDRESPISTQVTDFNSFFAEVRQNFETLVKPFTEEPLKCAEEMAPDSSLEPFVFGVDGLKPNGDPSKYRFPTGFLVDGGGSGRDAHGQLRSDASAFTFTSYTDLIAAFDACEELHRNGIDQTKTDGALQIEIEQYIGNLTETCIPQFFEPMTRGFELTFGERPSPGFICGIKDAIVKDGKSIPGKCCLDAPWQGKLDQWGQAYDCSFECQNPGPFFAGMSEEACASHGGTFCANPTDCSGLELCIGENKLWAQENNEIAFLLYLESAPNITDATDASQCSGTREYFGFAGSFINDRRICEDIEQLRNNQDFSFIDEFFGTLGLDPEEIPDINELVFDEVPPLDLKPPDRSASKAAPVQNEWAWRASDFALRQVIKHTELAYDMIIDTPCPDLPFVGTFPCTLILFVAIVALLIVQFAAEVLLEISEQTFMQEVELSNLNQVRGFEDTAAVYRNMELTGEYMRDRFQDVSDLVATGVNNIADGVDAQKVQIIGVEERLGSRIDDKIQIVEQSLKDHIDTRLLANDESNQLELIHTKLDIIMADLAALKEARCLGATTSENNNNGADSTRGPKLQTTGGGTSETVGEGTPAQTPQTSSGTTSTAGSSTLGAKEETSPGPAASAGGSGNTSNAVSSGRVLSLKSVGFTLLAISLGTQLYSQQ
ncbi:expressed unknown protein [Seminavis robusta]|uniref:Uncharacterized protein n=1 Tax=Seminavis robusta TaxID=568900 RepID=A0A9N8E6P5_9STRA|nr:expressed unknown protein [Seminavis robusta]|eukprot:Sro554_g165560.1 n/a (1093) ;mRNA; f:41881-45770